MSKNEEALSQLTGASAKSDLKLVSNTLLVGVVMITRFQYYCVVIMLPLLADENHDITLSRDGVACYQLGLVISTQLIGQLFSTHLLSNLCMRMGHKNSIVFGYFWITAGSFGFAWVTQIDGLKNFLIAAFILRFTIGVGLGICNTTLIDVFRIDFPQEHLQFKGKYLASESVGFLLGPIIVAAFYSINGFFSVFITLATITCIGFIVVWWLLPARLNSLESGDDLDIQAVGKHDTMTKAANVVPFNTFFQNRRSLVGISFMFIGACFATFASVVFPIHLSNNEMSVALIAFSYEFALIFNLVTSIGLQTRMRQINKSTVYIIVGLLLFCLSPQLMGPNEGIKQKNWIRVLGYMTHAIASATISVSTFPEILKGTTDEMITLRPEFSDTLQVGEKTSIVVFNTKATAQIIAPCLGGLMYDYRGFYFGCSVITFCAATLLIFYLLVLIIAHIQMPDTEAGEINSVKHQETMQNHYDNEEIQGLLQDDSLGL